MASTKKVMGLVLTVMAVLYSAALAQSDCTNVLIGMSPCLNYITGNSSIPSSQCCSQLANVVRSSPKCLCDVLNGGGSQLGINVNQTQAMALPGTCKVQTPPVSSCKGGSGGFPGDSPAGSPNNSGSRSRTVPSSDGDGSSDGSSIKLSLSLLTTFFAVSYAVIFNTY